MTKTILTIDDLDVVRNMLNSLSTEEAGQVRVKLERAMVDSMRAFVLSVDLFNPSIHTTTTAAKIYANLGIFGMVAALVWKASSAADVHRTKIAGN